MTLPLVLLPGMMCDARLFGPQVSAFGEERTIVIVDRPGGTSVSEMAEDILEQAPPRFALAGLSMGGILAMEMVRQQPERINRLALLDTNPLAEANEVKARRAGQIDRATSGHLASVMRDEMKPNYLADGPDRARILDLCMDMALGLGPDVFRRQSIALRDRPNQTETLQGYYRPALVLCGRDDRLCSVERHELMHALLPNSELKIIDGAGHLPTLEQPDATTDALRRWLER